MSKSKSVMAWPHPLDGRVVSYGSAARIGCDDRKGRAWVGAPLEVTLSDWLDGYLVEIEGGAVSTAGLWRVAVEFTGAEETWVLNRRMLTSGAMATLRALNP